MEDYVSAQVDAMRSYDAAIGLSGDRIGFAWSPTNSLGLSTGDFNAEEADLLARLAAGDPSVGRPVGAGGRCLPAAVVHGRSRRRGVHPRLEHLHHLDADDRSLISVPADRDAGAATGPMSVELQIGGIVAALPVDSQVSVASSSSGGSFSSSPSGPWTPTLTLTVPAGSTSATFYMLDTAVGTPTVTATIGAQSNEQVESRDGTRRAARARERRQHGRLRSGPAPRSRSTRRSADDTASPTVASATVAIAAGLDGG